MGKGYWARVRVMQRPENGHEMSWVGWKGKGYALHASTATQAAPVLGCCLAWSQTATACPCPPRGLCRRVLPTWCLEAARHLMPHA